jgi:hypothetical protein
MSTSNTQQQTYDSLTGFDEIAIRQQFRTPISALVDEDTGDKMLTARALMFVELRRTGVPDAEAHQGAMSAPWSTVRDYFAAEAAPADQGGDPADPTAPTGQPTS